jgi:hypothetical protein
MFESFQRAVVFGGSFLGKTVSRKMTCYGRKAYGLEGRYSQVNCFHVLAWHFVVLFSCHLDTDSIHIGWLFQGTLFGPHEHV